MALLLPGGVVPPSSFPSTTGNRPLALGPGLRALASDAVQATTAGRLQSDPRKNALWIAPPAGGRYQPCVGDQVVAMVHRSTAEGYGCVVAAQTPPAMLGQLSFEGATKKTRPVLAPGALVYARVARVERGGDVELECVDPATGKADGLGPLKGGTVVGVSIAFARRVMMGAKGGCVVLEEFGAKLGFEVAVGRNGRVWVDAGGVKETLAVTRALRETDAGNLDVRAQKKLVEKILREG